MRTVGAFSIHLLARTTDLRRLVEETVKPKRYRFGRFLTYLTRGITHLLLKLDVSGVDEVPLRGPVALVGNHVNFLDPVLAYTVHRRYIKGMTAFETYRRPLYNFYAWAVDAIPVKRGTPDRTAIRACIEALEKGWALYIAPEGTRSHDGNLQKGRAGVTLILLHAGTHIPIYPVAFSGLEHFYHNLLRLRRTPVRVRIGDPFYLAPPEGHITRPIREQMIDEIMGQIAALMPPERRGIYADQAGKTPQYLRFVKKPGF